MLSIQIVQIKKEIKALGIGLISGCLVKERRRRGREGRTRVKGKLLVSFLSFPRWSDWATGAHAPAPTIEQLLICRFEDLHKENKEEEKP